jgi:hypothetical protein
MTDLYKPRDGLRIPMPGNQPDWPVDGRSVNLASSYEARLVKDGDLIKIEDQQPEATGSSGRKK